LTEAEIEVCKKTDTKIVHNPSAIFSIRGRCPVPELIEAGVTVAIGSDGTVPDRSYDMFRHMFRCMHYHRTYYRDPSYLPPGKVLEIVTIDAVRALGMEKEIGSLEVGKKADLILIDLFKPHLYPSNMPLYQLANFANGSDVDTVIVDGKVLMAGRQVKVVDERAALEMAQSETEAMLDRTGLRHLLETSAGFWGQSKLN
jgi:cytosine/adenosine deaminase-related metal-dependent hydrolase